MSNNSIIQLDNIKVYFPVSKGLKRIYLRAVDGVSLDICKGETLGLVGESGCGKSTLGRAIAGLTEHTAGNILFHGENIINLIGESRKQYRKNVQMIFQDPAASLNPRLKISQIVMESLINDKTISKDEKKNLIKETLKVVGLSEDVLNRYAHEFSGGQQQRIGIARSLVLKPEFIVCDEAVSALDVSVQAQVLNLLKKLKEEYNLTYLFISHNLSVVKYMCDKIAVMYLGKIVEYGTTEQIFNNPMHPYTKALISAIPVASTKDKPNRIMLEGDLPSPMDAIEGCAFYNRCFECMDKCKTKKPALYNLADNHQVSCLKYSN